MDSRFLVSHFDSVIGPCLHDKALIWVGTLHVGHRPDPFADSDLDFLFVRIFLEVETTMCTLSHLCENPIGKK